MMERWGLNGMQSFEQEGVRRKEEERLMTKPFSESPLEAQSTL